MDYPLESLNPERFQLFCQALLLKDHPDLQCFPVAQPDGGRDGRSGKKGAHIVFQVKFSRTPDNPQDVAAWLTGIIDDEIVKVGSLVERGAIKYVLITNTPGTAHKDAGSIDKVQTQLDRLPIDAMCLWRNDINRRLDNAWDLKWIYPELMTGPDLIHAVIERGLTEDQTRRAIAIRAFVGHQYHIDAEVKFKQIELQNKLLDLFVDVPVDIRGANPRTHDPEIMYAITRIRRREYERRRGAEDAAKTEKDDEVEDPHFATEEERYVGAAALLLSDVGQRSIKRAVLEGAPGQGKSTVTQYVCQIHRKRLLQLDISDIPVDLRDSPIRLPFRVDLRDLSSWLSKIDPLPDEPQVPADWVKSLESFLSAQVTSYSGGAAFNVNDLLSVFKLSSVLLIFDGLDEIAKISSRQSVVDELVAGLRRLDTTCADLQAIVTSRPAAFVNSPGMPAREFPYFSLQSLPRKLVDAYAEKWMLARRLTPAESKDVKHILKDKLGLSHIRDLSRNPMQLAILLSLIQRRGASLPDKRTALYDNYIDTFLNREVEKSPIVREHRDLLVRIHQYLAWILHCRSEAGRALGSIKKDELESVLRRFLQEEGYDPTIASDLFDGVTQRVVALVSRKEGSYEFEVQPLREYFAARYLYETAPYSPPGGERRGTKVDRFDAIARNFYWLNVTRFYAGCYSVGELPSLIDGLRAMMESEFRLLTHPRSLAAMLLSDYVFTQHRRSVRDLLSLILDGSGLKFYLAIADNDPQLVSSLVLPKDAGRDDLLDRAIALLKSDPSIEVASESINLIHANGGQDYVKEAWATETALRSPEQRYRWLQYGLQLGYFKSGSPPELERMISSVALSSSLVAQLIRGGRSDLLERDQLQFKDSVLLLLNNQGYHAATRRTNTLITALFNRLSFDDLAEVFDSPRFEPVSKIVQRDNRFPRMSEEFKAPSGSAFALGESLLGLIQDQFKLTAKEWVESLEPWDRVGTAIHEAYG